MRFMAGERSTSPVLEAMTSVPIAIQSLSEFMLFFGGERRDRRGGQPARGLWQPVRHRR